MTNRHDAYRAANEVLSNPAQNQHLEVNQLHHSINVRPARFFRIVPQTEYSYQMDVIQMPKEFKALNKNCYQFLLMIDVVSRKAFVRVLFPKSAQMGATGDDLKTQYSDIIEEDVVPNKASPGAVTADDQFDNQIFHRFNRTHGRGAYMQGRDEQEQGASIKMYNFISEDEHQTRGNKLGILDRAVRSIKMLLARYMTETADGKWSIYLQDVIDWYNKRQHRSLFTWEEGVDGSTKSKRKYWSPNEVFQGDCHKQFYLRKQHEDGMYNDNLMRKVPTPRWRPVVGGDYHVNMNGKEPSGPHPMGFRYKVNCKDSPHRRPQKRYKEWELVLAEDQKRNKMFSVRPPKKVGEDAADGWVVTQIGEPRLVNLDSDRSPQQKQEADQRRKLLTELSESQRQRRQLQLENYTNSEIDEMLKVAQHKSLRQVQQEALKALGDDKESVGETELEGLIRLRDTIEQCLKTFKNTVCSHSKLQQAIRFEVPPGHDQFVFAVCSSMLKTRILRKDKTDRIRKVFRGDMIRRLFQDINLRNNATVDAVIRHLLQANGGVTKLFEPCCAVDNAVKQRVQHLAAVLQDHAKTDQASNVILEQDTKNIIVSSWLALKAFCLSQERLPLCEDDVELLCNAYNIKLMFVVDQKIKCSRGRCRFIRMVRKQPSTFS
ncbi:hypothetical protein ABBQ38_006637 [Trebouxia sp. C0009 RCD-2024]